MLLAACAAPPPEPATPGAAPPVCGDGRCDAGEDAVSCPADCAPPPSALPTDAAPAPALAEPIVLAPCAQPLCERGEVVLPALRSRAPSAGLLGGRHVAIDPLRNLVYVAGGLTPRVAVLSGASGAWSATLEIGAEAGWRDARPLVDPVAGVLYLLDAPAGSLLRFDLAAGRVSGPAALPSGESWAAIDTQRERLLVVSGSSGALTAYSGSMLRQAFTSQAAGAGAGAIVYEEAGDRIFVLDRLSSGATRTITHLQASDGRLAGQIRFAAPTGERARELAWDPAGRRFIVGLETRLLLVDEPGAPAVEIALPEGERLEALAVDPGRGVVAALTRQLERPESALRLFAAAGGAPITSWTLPPSVGPPEANLTAGQFVLADPDRSQLWFVPSDGRAEPGVFWLGDSVDQLTAVEGRETLIISSRRGGGDVLVLDLAAGRLEALSNGEGLSSVGAGEQGAVAVALDTLHGELIVFDLDSRDGQASRQTLDLELPPGALAAGADLAVHAWIEQAYIVATGSSELLAADWSDQRVVARAALSAAMLSPPPGPDGLQVAVDPESGRIYVLRVEAPMRLAIYDLRAELALLAEADLGGIDRPTVQPGGPGRVLFADSLGARAFVGPYEIDPQTARATGRTLARGARVITSDSAGEWLLASERRAVEEGEEEVLIWLAAGSLEPLHEESLGPADLLPLVFEHEAQRGVLYVGWPAAARLRAYTLGPLD